MKAMIASLARSKVHRIEGTGCLSVSELRATSLLPSWPTFATTRRFTNPWCF